MALVPSPPSPDVEHGRCICTVSLVYYAIYMFGIHLMGFDLVGQSKSSVTMSACRVICSRLWWFVEFNLHRTFHAGPNEFIPKDNGKFHCTRNMAHFIHEILLPPLPTGLWASLNKTSLFKLLIRFTIIAYTANNNVNIQVWAELCYTQIKCR